MTIDITRRAAVVLLGATALTAPAQAATGTDAKFDDLTKRWLAGVPQAPAGRRDASGRSPFRWADRRHECRRPRRAADSLEGAC
ncbi:MAG: hypothetical protein WDN03_14010 [Rhizomicrobium sp.]